jgi:hypothetical protein
VPAALTWLEDSCRADEQDGQRGIANGTELQNDVVIGRGDDLTGNDRAQAGADRCSK